jgi:hypothetical protein
MTQAGIAKNDLFTPGRDYLVLAGSFVPNGTTQLANTRGVDVFGMGFTVARTGVGVYRVTITRAFSNVVSLTVNKTTNETNFCDLRVSAVTPPSGNADGFFDVTHLASADVSATNYAAADITASGILRRINFCAVLALGDFPGNGV